MGGPFGSTLAAWLVGTWYLLLVFCAHGNAQETGSSSPLFLTATKPTASTIDQPLTTTSSTTSRTSPSDSAIDRVATTDSTLLLTTKGSSSSSPSFSTATKPTESTIDRPLTTTSSTTSQSSTSDSAIDRVATTDSTLLTTEDHTTDNVTRHTSEEYELTLSIIGRPTAQSTTYRSPTYGPFPGELAVDGDINTYSHTKSDDHPWWRVDLGNEHCLGRITVTLRQGCCGEYRFTAAVARAGLGVFYAENQPCGQPAPKAQSYDGAVNIFTCDTPRMARYVSLDIDPSSPGVTKALLQMGEVTVEEVTSGQCYPVFEGSVRLVDGNSSSEGRVEVYYQGSWGTVCDDQFDIHDAAVICHQLGFPSAVRAVSAAAEFSIGSGPIFLDDLECSGDESTLANCSHAGWTEHNCGHLEDAGVICSTVILTTEDPVVYEALSIIGRPTAQSTSHDQYPGEFAVDGDINTFSVTEPNDQHPWWRVDLGSEYCLGRITVKLRQGCCGEYRFTAAVARAGLGVFYAENQPCGQPAPKAQSYDGAVNIFTCDTPRMARYVSLDIDPSSPGVTNALLQMGEVTVEEVASGQCSPVLDGSVRLVDGNSSSEGRIEIFFQGNWGTVCDDLFDILDATVICHQLDFPSAVRAVSAAAEFSVGSGPIFLDNVECAGDESALANCSHAGWTEHNCDHSEDAGVICSPLILTTEVPVVYEALSIVGRPTAQGTNSRNTGKNAVDGDINTSSATDLNDPHPWWRVDLGSEYCLGRITVTLKQGCCGEYRFTAAVARAGLGLSYTENQPCGQPAKKAQSYDGAVNVFTCDTPRMARYVSLDIDPSSPGVTNAFLQMGEVTVEEVTSGQCSLVSDGSVRLVDGNSSTEGRIEIFYQGNWGTVCDDLFDILDATVICHQLGFPSALRAVSAAAEFSVGSGAIVLDNLECSGDESTLADCSHAGWAEHNCSHSDDAGVICSPLILTTEVPVVYEALSIIGRPTAQGTNSGNTGKNAVDGDINTSSATDLNDPHPWWRVDLGSEYCLGRITVTLKQGCCGEYRFTAAVARAGLGLSYAENQPCGQPATKAQSYDGAVNVFTCDTPRMARYVSLDIDPSSPGVTNAFLQMGEVTVEEVASGQCSRVSGRINGSIIAVIAVAAALVLIIGIILITLVIRKVRAKRTRSHSSYQMAIPLSLSSPSPIP
ncbi:deleted in malignant brain tumors 1 protein-like [Patiria miniata]|uniref:SRCR domain-containing protein n=1 Tax=Patiria miniata TaxID=46514 RepID=A0A914ADW8_PATMI|nr:deleted in malignant brain tumors 1 protein-like [Patiria miniata]